MKKLIIHCSLLIALCSCGFSPMYSNKAELEQQMHEIYISPIAGTNGIDLRNYLIMSWNTGNPESSKYRLSISLGEPITIYKAIQRTGDATWEEVRMSAAWSLSEDGKVIAKSSETASESYSFVSDLVATDAAKTTAIQNTIKIIGEKIELKVNAKLKKNEN